jgi:hypothetical protein
VCEALPPAGYLLAEPKCQTVTASATKPRAAMTFFHQTGIYVPPPSEEM